MSSAETPSNRINNGGKYTRTGITAVDLLVRTRDAGA